MLLSVITTSIEQIDYESKFFPLRHGDPLIYRLPISPCFLRPLLLSAIFDSSVDVERDHESVRGQQECRSVQRIIEEARHAKYPVNYLSVGVIV